MSLQFIWCYEATDVIVTANKVTNFRHNKPLLANHTYFLTAWPVRLPSLLVAFWSTRSKLFICIGASSSLVGGSNTSPFTYTLLLL